MSGPLAGLLAALVIVFSHPPIAAGPHQAAAALSAPVSSADTVALPDLGHTLASDQDPPPSSTGAGVDLSGWKLTLPVGSKGKPTEVDRPRVARRSA